MGRKLAGLRPRRMDLRRLRFMGKKRCLRMRGGGRKDLGGSDMTSEKGARVAGPADKEKNPGEARCYASKGSCNDCVPRKGEASITKITLFDTKVRGTLAGKVNP